jgi:hypothetical protein
VTRKPKRKAAPTQRQSLGQALLIADGIDQLTAKDDAITLLKALARAYRLAVKQRDRAEAMLRIARPGMERRRRRED